MQIKFHQDSDAESPRDWENIGTISCRKHRRYSLGDAQFDGSVEDFVRSLPKGSIVLPVYMYDHGNISFSTTPYSCQFDSAQAGVIWCSPATIRKEYGNNGAASRATATKVLQGEVEVYSSYAAGEVYGIEIVRDGEEEECVGGFFGSNVFENGMADLFSDDELPALLEATRNSSMMGSKEQMSNMLAERLSERTQKAKASARPRRV